MTDNANQHEKTELTDSNLEANPFHSLKPEQPARWFEIKQWGALKLQGENCSDFLQGQTTCDLKKLSPSQALWGAHCNLKGRAFANFLVLEFQEELLLLGHQSLLSALGQSLEKYGIFNRLKTAIAPLPLVGRLSPKPSPVMEGNAPLPKQAPFSITQTEGVSSIRLTNKLTLQIAKDQQKLQSTNQALLLGSSRLWEAGLIDAGLACLSAPFQEQFIPNELNMDIDGGISFNKGCYLGQEVIARLHYKSTPKQRVVRLHLHEGTPELKVGQKLWASNNQTLGSVILCSQGVSGEGQALAMLRLKELDQCSNSSLDYTLNENGKRLTCQFDFIHKG